MAGSDIGYAATHLLCDVRYLHRLWCYAMSSTEPMQISVTELAYGPIAYGAMRCPVLSERTVLVKLGRIPHSREKYQQVAPYAMSGTGIPYAAIPTYARAMRCPALASRMLLRACYAMSGTSQHCAVLTSSMLLRACYAMPGTALAYAATRYAVLT
eukprot:223394-Rhodomonas_salina.5